jgi:hypothetical protein
VIAGRGQGEGGEQQQADSGRVALRARSIDGSLSLSAAKHMPGGMAAGYIFKIDNR